MEAINRNHCKMSNHSIIGSDTWLLNKTKGARLWDQLVLNNLKYSYLGLRVLLGTLLGYKEEK